MRIITSVSPGEVIEHTGDLTITDGVGEQSKIVIHDGSLIIGGNVSNGAKINVDISEELRNSISASQMGGRQGLGFNNNVSIGNVSIGNAISCNISVNDTYIQNVNINNRIFTDGMVKKLSTNKYQILPYNGDISSVFQSILKPMKGTVNATVDGKKYRGSEIIVDGKEVYVDGKLASDLVSALAKENQISPPKVVIQGSLEDNVTLLSDADIEIQGNVGNTCGIASSYAGLTAKNIGKDTNITVRNQIAVANVDMNCILSSQQYGLSAGDIGEYVVIKVREEIKAQNIANHCRITSHQYGIVAGNIGQGVSINVRDAISVRNVGENSSLTSNQYGLKARNIAAAVTINARGEITVNSVGDNSRLTSIQYGIEVDEQVGKNSVLQARDDIKVGGLGDYSELTSNTGKIKVSGTSGESVVIKAKNSIHLKDVGNTASIVSSYDEVTARNIGHYVTIMSRNDIEVEGCCPHDASLISQHGKVKKSPQSNQDPVPVSKNNYATGSFESDLQKALELSNAEILKNQGVFAKTFAPIKEPEIKIPDAYRCIITQAVMTKPVVCTLDENTYEEAAIRKWLMEHRNSPTNRVSMKPNQSIDEVLVKNRNLEGAIEEFRKANPSLFTQEQSQHALR